MLMGYVLWRVLRYRRSGHALVWYRELCGLALALVLPVLMVALNVLVPRPMAKLYVDDPNTIVVDVHAHTSSSHDGRPDWTQDRVRRWHAASGFHVAYITDHKYYGGAIDGLARNPARAGDGTVLLSGLELRSAGQHINVLSMTPAESVYIVHGDHLVKGLKLTDGREPAIIQTIPFKLPKFSGSNQDSLPRTTAIEINDGAPKGLTTGLKLHRELLQLADSFNLTLVAGSDNHGWGNTASGWTLISLPGWQAMTPPQLAAKLDSVMRSGRNAATVVERRTPMLITPAAAALTVPAMLVSVLRGLSPIERVSWIVWAWMLPLWWLVRRMVSTHLFERARAARRLRRTRWRVTPLKSAADV
jgi:hypothetical protein